MLNPTATYIDSFGNGILRNGRRPENTETTPRIAEKYQMLKLENALAPCCLLCSFKSSCPPSVDLLGIARHTLGP